MHSFSFAEGEVLLINKPLRWTSFDVVGKIRQTIKLPKLKVGHAGTLDPLATGLLIVCTGKFTKTIDSYQAQEKTYEGTFVLGGSTPTFDLESEINAVFETGHITASAIKAAAHKLTGEIEQLSPPFSALRINGERAYEVARRGEVPLLKARRILVRSFEVDATRFPEIDFKIVCSKGTYVRSLVSQIGLDLHSGAYLSRLSRTAIGGFTLGNAWEMDALINAIREWRGLAAPLPAYSRKEHTLKGFHEKAGSGEPS